MSTPVVLLKAKAITMLCHWPPLSELHTIAILSLLLKETLYERLSLHGQNPDMIQCKTLELRNAPSCLRPLL